MRAGTGAAYCQIIDSIFGDVPMNKVKFEAKQEYEYLSNFRILQNSFKVHGVDKVRHGTPSCKQYHPPAPPCVDR